MIPHGMQLAAEALARLLIMSSWASASACRPSDRLFDVLQHQAPVWSGIEISPNAAAENDRAEAP